MAYRANYVKAFKYALFFGKDIHPGDEVFVSVCNEDDVLLAVKKAYIDMSPRTFKKKDDHTDEDKINPVEKNNLFNYLAKKISGYFSGREQVDDFNAWHKELCEYFIKEYKRILANAKMKADGVTYGKAQKIVNMTFKYAYCFDDACNYAQKFEPCQIPLDHYILDWFFSWYKEIWEEQNPGKKLTKSGKYTLCKWSNLDYEKENGELIPQYKEIQEAIKNRLSARNVTPLEAEFLIWYEAKKAEEATKNGKTPQFFKY